MKEADVPFSLESITLRVLIVNLAAIFVSGALAVFGAPTDRIVADDFQRTSTSKGHVFPRSDDPALVEPDECTFLPRSKSSVRPTASRRGGDDRRGGGMEQGCTGGDE